VTETHNFTADNASNMPGTSEKECGDLVILQKNCHMKVKALLSKASFLICLHHNKINDMAFTDIICLVETQENQTSCKEGGKKGMA
jgi:hypothetical protein